MIENSIITRNLDVMGVILGVHVVSGCATHPPAPQAKSSGDTFYNCQTNTSNWIKSELIKL